MVDFSSMTTQLLMFTPFLAALLFTFWRVGHFTRNLLATLFMVTQVVLSFYGLISTVNGSITVSLIGGWTPPFGIVIVMDGLSAIFLIASNLVFLSALSYYLFEKRENLQSTNIFPLVFLLQAGVNLSLLTSDFFNLFVGMEILLCSSYALLALSSRPKELQKIYNYMILSMITSFVMLLMVGCLYAFTGNLSMAAVSRGLQQWENTPLVTVISCLTLLIFGLKTGIFPLYFWLPECYPVLPPSLAGLFGGVLSKVGFYILIRMFLTVLPHDQHQLYLNIGVLSGLTMLLGVIGAVSQKSIKNILSYHILSQSGYMIFALSMFSPFAIAAAIFFAIHNILVKSSLYLLGGIGQQIFKSDSLKHVRGLWELLPLGGLLFFIQAMSLAGIPPLSGFWGKYMIIVEAISSEYWSLTIIAVVSSFLTFFSMLKIWHYGFMGQAPSIECSRPIGSVVSTMPLVLASLFLCFGADYAMSVTHEISQQIFKPSIYQQAVLSLSGKGAAG